MVQRLEDFWVSYYQSYLGNNLSFIKEKIDSYLILIENNALFPINHDEIKDFLDILQISGKLAQLPQEDLEKLKTIVSFIKNLTD